MHQNLIKHIRRFIELNDNEVEILLKYIVNVDVEKKNHLLHEGQQCNHYYFVSKGCLRMYYLNANAEEQTTQFALEGWWISDYFSFLDNVPSEYNIQAIEKSEIIQISQESLNKLIKQIPLLQHYFYIILQRTAAANQKRLKNIYELSKEEIFNNFNLSFPEFIQRIPQYMLASYLGITAEYVSKLRKKK